MSAKAMTRCSTPEKIVATLGRHPNDLMTSSYYMRTPSEIYVECGWGVKEVEDTTPPLEMTSVGSFWGHKGLFEDIGAPPSAVPDVGTRRAPVQVMEGNRHLYLVERDARQRALENIRFLPDSDRIQDIARSLKAG
jgi:hypothetical protein